MKRFVTLPLILAVLLSACTLVPQDAVRDLLPTSTPFRTAEAAFHVLIERQVDKPTSSLVLAGAVDGIVAKLKRDGVTDPIIDRPAFTDRTQSDFQRFTDTMNATLLKYPATDKTKLEQAAVDGMAKALNECHTYYIDPDRAKSFNRPPQPYFGIGALINKPVQTEPVEVTGVIAGSPAEKAGVRAGDRVKLVNGEDVTALQTEEVANKIRGPEGTSVPVVFIRGTADITLTITRARVQQSQVASRMEEGGIGYVSVAALNGRVAQETKDAVQGLLDQKATGIILDLRNDPGGDFPVAIDVGSIFVKDGILVYNVGRDGKREEIRTRSSWNLPVPRPVVVLVNRASASGAEIIAAGIRANGVGRIIGTRSAGCVGTARVQEMPDGGTLLVGDSKMQDAKTGANLHGPDNGVVPDEIVTNPSASDDQQLKAALAYLKLARG